jgi:hypothetical protein
LTVKNQPPKTQKLHQTTLYLLFGTHQIIYCFKRSFKKTNLLLMKLLKFEIYLLLFLTNAVHAQHLQGLASQKAQVIEKVNILQLNENQKFIPMDFARHEVLKPELTKFLSQNIILKIELVYTRFRLSSDFNQKQLNIKRLEKLKALAPDIFKNPVWEFQLLEQTAGNSPEECREMFHGFLITYRYFETDESIQTEAKYLENLFKEDASSTPQNPDSEPTKIKYKVKSRWDDRVGFVHDSIPESGYSAGDTALPANNQSNDMTVYNVFERNQQWKNMMIVMDATGSMSPHIGVALKWIKQQTEQNRASFFVFFNDGNKTSSNAKVIGNTGGIYIVESRDFAAVLSTAVKCMKNGSGGGETMENDVEAILAGINYSNKYEEIVLIADNYETMRDFQLIPSLKKPIRVILCGSGNRINAQYLTLARETGGSVHTTKSDIYDLKSVSENGSIEIEGKTYRLLNGVFWPVF